MSYIDWNRFLAGYQKHRGGSFFSCGRERLPEKRGGEKPEEGCEQNAARKTGKSAAPKP